MAGEKRFSKIVNLKTRQIVIVSLVALASAACSSDVTRFSGLGEVPPAMPGEATASIPESSRTAAAPLERVETTSLAPPPAEPYGMAKRVTIEQGDTLYSVSRRYNVSVDEIAASNNLAKPYNVRVGQSLVIPAPGVAPTAWNKPDYKLKTSARRATSIAKNSRQPLPRNPVFSGKSNQVAGVHTVKSGETLYGISRGAGLKPEDIMRYNNIAPGQVIKVGQRLKIPGRSQSVAMAGPAANASVPLPKRAPAVSVKRNSPAIAKASPAAKPKAKRPVKIVRLQNPPERSYGKFRWPVKGRIISEFGRKPNGERNEGINFSVPMGASVRAAENGVIAYAGNELKGYGNLILIRHSGDWVTAYAHNSKLMVRQGQKVRRGDIIAKAGQTGSVDRPQLHFEIRKGAQAVNPRKYMAGSA